MKTILKIVVGLLIASALFLAGFATIKMSQGDDVHFYDRFTKSEDGKSYKFNWMGILSPIASESQKVIHDTVKFTKRVIYPIGPKFNVVAPTNGDSAENVVAYEIAKVISDSINKIVLDLTFDYDGQAKAVRNAQNPQTPKLEKSKVFMSLFGTASPEAAKYGFEKSIQPGELEAENAKLASQRLLRTDTLILKHLSSFGIKNVKITELNSAELQLKSNDEVSKVLSDHNVLNKMRYVQADVTIATERLKITPATAPILLPIWLALFSLLIWVLSSLKRKEKVIPEKISPVKKIYGHQPTNWWEFNLLGLMILVFFFAMMLLFPKWVLICFLIVILLYALYLIYKYTTLPKFNLRFSLRPIWNWLVGVWRWIRNLFSTLGLWWGCRTTCQKILLIHFLLDIVALVTWMMGLWHVCF